MAVLVLFYQFNPPQQLKNAIGTGPSKEVIERTFKFSGPFVVGRRGDALTFNLTAPEIAHDLPKGDFRLESVSFSGGVGSESETFGFDQEILVFSPPERHAIVLSDATDYDLWQKIRNGYAPSRRVLQMTTSTEAGRTGNSNRLINWSVDLASSVATSGEIKAIKDSPISVSNGRLYVQLFLWTLWGGDHFVQLKDIEVKLRMSQI